MVRNTFGADLWSGFEWVVWQIVVDDPENRISAPYETEGIRFMLAERSRASMTELAARLGCVYEGCKDDGTFGSDDDPYYAWWVRVPAAEHARRGPRG
ncbi:hypothetical protein [Streptomyces sp. NPDC002537]